MNKYDKNHVYWLWLPVNTKMGRVEVKDFTVVVVFVGIGGAG